MSEMGKIGHFFGSKISTFEFFSNFPFSAGKPRKFVCQLYLQLFLMYRGLVKS